MSAPSCRDFDPAERLHAPAWSTMSSPSTSSSVLKASIVLDAVVIAIRSELVSFRVNLSPQYSPRHLVPAALGAWACCPAAAAVPSPCQPPRCRPTPPPSYAHSSPVLTCASAMPYGPAAPPLCFPELDYRVLSTCRVDGRQRLVQTKRHVVRGQRTAESGRL